MFASERNYQLVGINSIPKTTKGSDFFIKLTHLLNNPSDEAANYSPFVDSIPGLSPKELFIIKYLIQDENFGSDFYLPGLASLSMRDELYSDAIKSYRNTIYALRKKLSDNKSNLAIYFIPDFDFLRLAPVYEDGSSVETVFSKSLRSAAGGKGIEEQAVEKIAQLGKAKVDHNKLEIHLSPQEIYLIHLLINNWGNEVSYKSIGDILSVEYGLNNVNQNGIIKSIKKISDALAEYNPNGLVDLGLAIDISQNGVTITKTS